jgi:hypothetical protein
MLQIALMRMFCYLFLFSFSLACSKNKNIVKPIDSPLIGSWHPETAPDGRALIFQENGDLLYTQWGDTLALPYSRFQIINDSTVNLIRPDLTINNVSFRVVTISELHLEGACIMNCSERLYRISPL